MPGSHISAVETHNLTKRFGSFRAVDNVSLIINPGEVYALIGPNGAGKTTLLKILVGLAFTTGGKASIYGHDVIAEPLAAKTHIGYVPDDPSAYDYLTGNEFLILTARLRGLSGSALEERLRELASVFPIRDLLDQPMSRYSRGNKQKVAVLAALMTKPPLLVIDEPIVGLDTASITILGKTLRQYAKDGNAVLFVTHIVDFAKTYATRAGIMKNGKIIKELPIKPKTRIEELV